MRRFKEIIPDMNLKRRWLVCVMVFLFTSCSVSPNPGAVDTAPGAWSAAPVRFFQKYLSGADGDRCAMNPSCSAYCVEAIEKHGSIAGWIMCCDRLMRCGRDEVSIASPIWINGEKRCHDPVSANDFWWKDSHECE